MLRLLKRIFIWFKGNRKPKEQPPVAESGATAAAGAFDQSDEVLEAPEKGPKRPLLYMFQYVALPEAVFQNHPELICELGGKRPAIPLLHFWAKARLHCTGAGLVDPFKNETIADLEAEAEMFRAVVVHPHQRNGYTVFVVTMPTPQAPPEAHFVAIVHKDDEPKDYGSESPSTRYFTLEKSSTRLPVLCECCRDGSRRNYGEGPAPLMADFVEAVFERVAAGLPGSNRVLFVDGCQAVMMFAPPSSKEYHLVCVEFEDGTMVRDAKLYRQCELELPPQLIGKKINSLIITGCQP